MEAGGIEQNSNPLGILRKCASNVSKSGALQKPAPNSRSITCLGGTDIRTDRHCVAYSNQGQTLTPKLERIVDAWPSLPPHIQESIIALVDAVDLGRNHRPLSVRPSVQSARVIADNFSKSSSEQLSRTILKALRHTPELYSLRMDSDGRVSCGEFRYLVSQLTGSESVLKCDDIQVAIREIGLSDRVQFKDGFVRAYYGHSTAQFAPTQTTRPDEPLFHGTSADNWSMIECFGLSPAKRRFVQLTTDFDYAGQIANSHSRSPIVLQVATTQAIANGVKFYSTDTHVWQATAVPATCLQVWMDDTFVLEEPHF